MPLPGVDVELSIGVVGFAGCQLRASCNALDPKAVEIRVEKEKKKLEIRENTRKMMEKHNLERR